MGLEYDLRQNSDSQMEQTGLRETEHWSMWTEIILKLYFNMQVFSPTKAAQDIAVLSIQVNSSQL
jgi:hypothetical protein